MSRNITWLNLGVIVVLAAMLLLGAACGPTPTPTKVPAMPVPPTPVPPTPVPPTPTPALPPETVVILQPGEASTLDWHKHCDMNAHEPDRNIFDTLLRRDMKTLEIKPHLAESFKLVKDTVWEFKLRKGVKFHNGEPLNAEAVKFSLERFVDPKTAAPGRGVVALIDHVDIIDEYTVNVVTKEPFPLLPVRMTSGHCGGNVAIVPPKYTKEKGDAYFATNPVGTGPFKFVEWKKDEYIKLEANTDYFLGPPAFKYLVFKPVPEPATRLAALLAGQADLIINVTPEQIPRIEASGVAKVKETTFGAFMIMTKITNYVQPGPWTDKRVRQAINHAIDLDTIIKAVLKGHGSVLGLPLEKEAFGKNPKLPEYYPYDPEKAKKLLAEAGYPKGFEMTIHCPNRRYLNDIEIAQAMAAQLEKVGIIASVQVWEQSVYATKWRLKQLLPAYIVAWGGAGLFDGDIMTYWAHTGSALSIYSNKEVDKLLDEARATMDPEKRKELYWKLQELLYEEAPVIKAWQQSHIFGVSNRLDWEPWIDNILLMYYAKLRK